MKILFSSLVLLSALFAWPQQQMTAPEKPAAKNAGRVVKLTEVLRISDEQGGFYFKYPGNIRVAEDGAIFLTDEKQLLKFDAQGKFAKNLFKQGQGPGELNNIGPIRLNGNKIVASSNFPLKLVEMDLQGGLQREIKPTKSTPLQLVHACGDSYYCINWEIDFSKIKSGPGESANKLLRVDAAGKIGETGFTFIVPFQAHVERSGGGVGVMMNQDFQILVAPVAAETIFISASADYELRKIDLAHNRLVFRLTKPFKKVAYVKPKEPTGGKMIVNGREVKPQLPDPEFFPDIVQLQAVKDRVWVFTSLVEKGKGAWVDVFGPSGRYEDGFYLDLPQVENPGDLRYRPLAIKDGFLYTIEKDEEDTPTLVKYKINM